MAHDHVHFPYNLYDSFYNLLSDWAWLDPQKLTSLRASQSIAVPNDDPIPNDRRDSPCKSEASSSSTAFRAMDSISLANMFKIF